MNSRDLFAEFIDLPLELDMFADHSGSHDFYETQVSMDVSLSDEFEFAMIDQSILRRDMVLPSFCTVDPSNVYPTHSELFRSSNRRVQENQNNNHDSYSGSLNGYIVDPLDVSIGDDFEPSVEPVLDLTDAICGPKSATRNDIANGQYAGPYVTLNNSNLWSAMHEHGNEAMITSSGRRLFPSLSVNLCNVSRGGEYIIALDIVQVSRYPNRYNKKMKEWVLTHPSSQALVKDGHVTSEQVVAEIRRDSDTHMYLHPESPQSGAHLMQSPVGFEKCVPILYETDFQDQSPNSLA